MDNYAQWFFRCNSTLEHEDTLYNVECIYDEGLSGKLRSITRREDATVKCSKIVGNYSFRAGVSQNSDCSKMSFQHWYPIASTYV